MTRGNAGRHGRGGQQRAAQRVELQIDELVLHGFDHGDRYRIGRAISSELARLITDKGIPPVFSHDADLPSLDGGPVNLPAGARPDTVGIRVAREVYGRMRR